MIVVSVCLPSDALFQRLLSYLGFSYLIDRVSDELWTEGHDIVKETGIKTIPNKNKCKKAKWLPEEALQVAVKKKGSEKQRRKGKIYPFECRVPKNTKER